MPLTSGTRLGPYEIVGRLGAGGMGEVYRARDTRLDRTVAIKILPEALASDAQFRERFDREARAISQLNHPHICTLHDIGHQDGIDYLVLEYLEGETLGDRLAKGGPGAPLRVEEALQVAIQIADALDKAHQRGIIHRDLKPGNIMLVRPGGSGVRSVREPLDGEREAHGVTRPFSKAPPVAKLLDFGLAKATGPSKTGHYGDGSAGLQAALTAPPTITTPLTAQGAILGTFRYMAPEQFEGKEADARTDIFAFGCVLFEMLTGKRAFEGKTNAGLMAAILEHDPAPVSSLGRQLPPALDHVVELCLAKQPDERWQSVHDLLEELKWIARSGVRIAEAPRSRARLAWLVAAAAISLAVAAVVAMSLRQRETPAPQPTVRFQIFPPGLLTARPGAARYSGLASVSPDGRQVAFLATGPEGAVSLWVQPLDVLTPRRLPDTDGAVQPFWSPDGRFLGFFAQGRLKKVDVAGGTTPVVLSGGMSNPRGGTWGREGVILYADMAAGGLWRVPATGGAPTRATEPAKRGDRQHFWPSFLPDGRRYLFLAINDDPKKRGIHLGSLDSDEAALLANVDSNGAYSAPGHLLFMRGDVLVAQPFDVERRTLTGEAVPVAERVGWALAAVRRGEFAVSETGVLVYTGGVGFTEEGLGWFDRGGKKLGVLDAAPHMEISPDGARVAADRLDRDGERDIWIHDTRRGTRSRVTFNPGMDWVPAWSPDGARIAFTSDKGGPAGVAQIYVKLASGAGSEELLLKTDQHKHHLDWSRDGRFLAFESLHPQKGQDLWVLPMAGDRKPILFLQTDFNEGQPQFSPDSRFLAYVSDESGALETYVQTVPLTGGKWQVSANGGLSPRWRRDGRELFYLARDGKIMAVDADLNGPTFGVPRPLFQTAVPGDSLTEHFAVAPDGQKFLLRSLLPEDERPPITVVLNWASQLPRNR